MARRWERLYWVPFLVSMAWMAVLSYVLVWMVDLVGDTLGLPNAVSSITISAAATSVSDCFSSLIVARKGILVLPSLTCASDSVSSQCCAIRLVRRLRRHGRVEYVRLERVRYPRRPPGALAHQRAARQSGQNGTAILLCSTLLLLHCTELLLYYLMWYVLTRRRTSTREASRST